MAENLKTTKYRNGDSIPNVTDNATWGKVNTGAYCLYKNDPANKLIYGALYNGFSVKDSRNIAPEGWHVPTDSEWSIVINNFGGYSVAGNKLKESGSNHWSSPYAGCTNAGFNSSGFTALPGGERVDGSPLMDGGPWGIGEFGQWWSSSESLPNCLWMCYIGCCSPIVSHISNSTKWFGFSVRCVKD